MYSRQLRWRDTLNVAEAGLALEPEHQSCANFRALALTNLGLTAAANAAVHEALASDPDNAYSHANRGWLLLRESRVEEAVDSFRAALRLDPAMDWARLGILEAMKARNRIYRLMLRYSIWSSSLSTRAVLVMIFSFVFVSRLAREAQHQNPSLWPLLGPIMAACGLLLFGPWFSEPLSNLFLRINPVGRLALSRFETTASNVVGVCLSLAAVSGLVFIATRSTPWLVLAGVCTLMLIPIGGAVRAHGTRAWPSLALSAVVLGAGGVIAVIGSLVDAYSGGELLTVLIVATILWSWLANYALAKYQ